MELDHFLDLRTRFVALHGEPKRLTEQRYPESFSCLHLTNPNMVPMTLRGMQMLHSLWLSGCQAPPLPHRHHRSAGRAPAGEASVPPLGTTLLETMPGAALHALGLPYRGYKNGLRSRELRQSILRDLPQRSPVQVEGLNQLQQPCMESHDCLDAVVAAVVAAIWLRDRALFPMPPTKGDRSSDQVLLEGWLYVPWPVA